VSSSAITALVACNMLNPVSLSAARSNALAASCQSKSAARSRVEFARREHDEGIATVKDHGECSALVSVLRRRM
jgi:hypothetical protein